MYISVLIKQLLQWIYNIICWIRMMVSSMSRWKSLMLYFGGPLVRKKCIIMKTVVFNWNCLFFLYTFENHGSSYMINIYWLCLRVTSILSDSGIKLVRVSGQIQLLARELSHWILIYLSISYFETVFMYISFVRDAGFTIRRLSKC